MSRSAAPLSSSSSSSSSSPLLSLLLLFSPIPVSFAHALELLTASFSQREQHLIVEHVIENRIRTMVSMRTHNNNNNNDDDNNNNDNENDKKNDKKNEKKNDLSVLIDRRSEEVVFRMMNAIEHIFRYE